MDKRKTNPDVGSEVEDPAEDARNSGASSAAPPAPLRQTFSQPPLRGGAASSDQGSGASFDDESGAEPDGSSLNAGVDAAEPGGFSTGEADESSTGSTGAEGASVSAVGGADDGADYLDDLRRVQAEFDNFRKRTFRERQQLEARGKRRLIEHLLPVLDNFERAIAHGEGGAGVELVFRELKSSLASEGLAEIEAEGKPFDPQVHEAVESVEDPDVAETVVTQVYRRGYTFGDELVRPAMVVVARPAESDHAQRDVAEGGV